MSRKEYYKDILDTNMSMIRIVANGFDVRPRKVMYWLGVSKNELGVMSKEELKTRIRGFLKSFETSFFKDMMVCFEVKGN